MNNIFFWHQLRIHRTWQFKVPLLMCFPYLAAFVSGMHAQIFFQAVALSFVTIIGFAGFAYTLNDLGDIAVDQKANKENAVQHLGRMKTILLILFCLVLTLAPWYFLPHSNFSIFLLFFELLFFYLYAMKPFRLKERGVAGLLCDALYAHALPAVLAFYTFMCYNKDGFSFFPYILPSIFLWQLLCGLRNIVFHQMNDYQYDKAADVKTWVSKNGLAKAEFIVKGLLILELMAFFLFLLLLTNLYHVYILLPAYLLYLIYSLVKHRKVLSVLPLNDIKFIFLDQFYLYWLPLLILAWLVQIEMFYLLMFIIHFVSFQNALKPWLNYQLKYFKKSV